MNKKEKLEKAIAMIGYVSGPVFADYETAQGIGRRLWRSVFTDDNNTVSVNPMAAPCEPYWRIRYCGIKSPFIDVKLTWVHRRIPHELDT